jgi:hypothetical protein
MPQSLTYPSMPLSCIQLQTMASLFLPAFIFLITMKLGQVMAGAPNCGPIVANDIDRIQFAFNLEFLEAEFFLYGALGRGLDSIAPTFAAGGPPPIGAKKANLDRRVRRIIEEFAYQEVGHLRSYRNIYIINKLKTIFQGYNYNNWRNSKVAIGS